MPTHMGTNASMECFAPYYNTETLSDVMLRFGEYKLPAHKLVLANGSGFFKAMFEGNFQVRSRVSTGLTAPKC